MVIVNPGSTNRKVFYMAKYKSFDENQSKRHIYQTTKVDLANGRRRRPIKEFHSKIHQKTLFSNNKQMVLVNPGSTNREMLVYGQVQKPLMSTYGKTFKNPQFSNNKQIVLVNPGFNQMKLLYMAKYKTFG